MQIINFIHDLEKEEIRFTVVRNGVNSEVSIKKTMYGTSHSDGFAEDWSDEEYSQMEDFIDGCSGMLHCFYHY